MSGIVERLRRGIYTGFTGALTDEAADEIERLREHVDALRLVATANEPEALRLQAEIERLQTANEYAFTELTALRAEIERLRALLNQVRIWMKNIDRRESEEPLYQAIRRALEPKP